MNKLTKIVALTKTAQEQALVQAQVQETLSLIKAFQTGKMATLKKKSRFPETSVSRATVVSYSFKVSRAWDGTLEREEATVNG